MPRYWLAPVGLCLLQSAQVGVIPDTNGRYHLAIGAALGSYLEQSVSCNGTVLDEERVDLSASSIEGEAWLSPQTRLTLSAGRVTYDPDGAGHGSYFAGGFGGALIALERRSIGVGAGLGYQPGPADRIDDGPARQTEGHFVPQLYLRAGTLDRIHARAEVGGPAAPGAPPDVFRIGIASGWGTVRKIGWRVDFGYADFPAAKGENYQMQLRLPLGEALDLGLIGQLRPTKGGDVGLSARYHWGDPR